MSKLPKYSIIEIKLTKSVYILSKQCWHKPAPPYFIIRDKDISWESCSDCVVNYIKREYNMSIEKEKLDFIRDNYENITNKVKEIIGKAKFVGVYFEIANCCKSSNLDVITPPTDKFYLIIDILYEGFNSEYNISRLINIPFSCLDNWELYLNMGIGFHSFDSEKQLSFEPVFYGDIVIAQWYYKR